MNGRSVSQCRQLLLFVLFVCLVFPGRALDEIEPLLYSRDIQFKMLESRPDGFTLELTNNNTEKAGDDQSRISASCVLASPAGATVTATFKSATWSIQWPDRLEGPLADTEESTGGVMPQSFTRPTAGAIDVFRFVGASFFRVGVTSTIVPETGNMNRGVAFLNTAVYDVSFSGGKLADPPSPPEIEKVDPYLIKMARETFVNADQVASLVRNIPEPEYLSDLNAWNRLLKNAETQGPVLMFRVPNSGPCRITPAEVSRLGVNPAELITSKMRLYAGNVEIPFFLDPPVDAPFVGDVALTFHLPAPPTPRYNYIPVWLMQPSAQDLETTGPLRIKMDPAPSVNRQVSSTEASLTASEFVFEPVAYDRRYPFTEMTGRWSMAEVAAGNWKRFSFDIEGLNASRTGQISISFTGKTIQSMAASEIYVNGTPVGQREILKGSGPFVKVYPLEPGVLREGNNDLRVFHPEVDVMGAPQSILVNSAMIKYPVDPARFPINREVEVSGPEGSALQIEIPRPELTFKDHTYLFDVTRPASPVRLELRSGRNPAAVHRFYRWITCEPTPQRLIYSDAESLRYPGNGLAYKYEELLSPNEPSELVIVAHPDVSEGLWPLEEHRRKQGVRLRTILVDSVYASFTYGYQSSDAIKRLVETALYQWPAPRINRLLLAGEASDYWWEYRRGKTNVSPNQIPTFGLTLSDLDVMGDSGYGNVAGTGQAQDVEVGRIPAHDRVEAEDVCKRISLYEKSPQLGPWMTRHLFIADDESEFARVAERIIGTGLDANAQVRRIYLQKYPYEDYFRIYNRKRSASMTEDIIDALSDGALTATYLGHGGPNLWSAERIFHYRDIMNLHTEGRRPIMTAASCDTAWMDYPIEPVRRSLAERFILSNNGGGIAVYAPVAGTSSYEHDFLLRPFFSALSEGKFQTIGQMTLYSKLVYLAERNQGYVTDQFVLLGDPGLRVPTTTHKIALEISPPDLFANQRATIHVSGRVASMPWGMANVSMLDSKDQVVAGPGRTPISQETFNVDLALPPYVSAGNYKLVAEASNESEGRYEVFSYPLVVSDPDVELKWDCNPPLTEILKPGDKVAIKLTAVNKTSSYMENLQLILRDASKDASLTSRTLTLEPGKELTWGFEMGLPPGITVLSAEAKYPNHPSDVEPLVDSRVELRALSEELPMASAPGPLVAVERQGSPQSTTFQVHLYNLQQVPLKNVSAELFLMDRPEGTPVGNIIHADNIPAAGKAILEFTDPSRFPEGKLSFRLDFEGEKDGSSEKMQQQIPMAIRIPVGTDLEVMPGSVHCERDAYVRGETVFVRARIRNRGETPVTGVRTTLFVGTPWFKENQAESNTEQSTILDEEPFLPGEEREVRLRWDPPPPANPRNSLYVVVNSDQSVVEVNYQNNVGDVQVAAVRLPNIAFAEGGVQLSSPYIRQGDILSITVPYLNDSPYDFSHSFVIEIRAQGREIEDHLIYRGTISGLDSGERAMIQANWQVDGIRDTIYVSLNEDREYGEDSNADNVIRANLDYVFPGAFLGENPMFWDFKGTLANGEAQNLFVGPDDTLQLVAFPQNGKVIPFEPEFVVGEKLPEKGAYSETDNLIGLEEEALRWSVYENPKPVQLRIPMDAEDGTTLYDIYASTPPQNRENGKPGNIFRYRFEDEHEWINTPDRTSAKGYLGRVESKDDWFDFSIGTTTVPASTTIFSITAIPIAGTYLSPLYEIDGVRPGTFEAKYRAEGASHIEFWVRYGVGTPRDPQLADWIEVEPGGPVPINRDARIVQWKCRMVGDRVELPHLESVAIDFSDDRKLAEVSK